MLSQPLVFFPKPSSREKKMAAICRVLTNCRTQLTRSAHGTIRVAVNPLSRSASSVYVRCTGRELSLFGPLQTNDASKDGTSSSEIETAREAAKVTKDNPTIKHEPTVFSKIISKEVAANIVYEDDAALAFEDVNPQTPCHVLVIPKKHIAMLSDVEEQDKDVR